MQAWKNKNETIRTKQSLASNQLFLGQCYKSADIQHTL